MSQHDVPQLEAAWAKREKKITEGLRKAETVILLEIEPTHLAHRCFR